MKRIVLYCSKHGSTKEYSKYLAYELKCEYKSLKEFDLDNIKDYDTIIFGSYISVEKIVMLQKFLKYYYKYPEKNYVFFCLGVLIRNKYQKSNRIKYLNFPEGLLEKVKLFYFTGRLDLDEVSFIDKFHLTRARSSIKRQYKLDPIEEHRSDLCHLTYGVDIIKLEDVNEIVEYVNKKRF